MNTHLRYTVRERPSVSTKDAAMTTTLAVGPLISLIAGILILLIPRLLNYIVALYLIIIGTIGLFGSGRFSL
jgi:hypothetical protein